MWVKKRHRFFTIFFRPIFTIFFKLRYRFTHDKSISMKEGSIIICNHTTTFDPLMVSLLFKDPVYIMTSKDLFNHRVVGTLLAYSFNPIPKEKSKKSDITAIKNCLRVAKENGNILVFPEGNRTLSGKLCNVDYSIVKLIKSLKKPLIICNMNGGYASDPRWGQTVRKGKLHASIKHIYQYDEIKDMDNDELYELVINGLTVNDFEYYHNYKGRNLAEHLERVFYVCPVCGAKHTIYTKKDKIYCSKCHLEVTYLKTLRFSSSTKGFNFTNVSQWYDWQVELLKEQTFATDELIYQDDMEFYLSIPFKSKQLIGKGSLKLYGSYFEFEHEKETLKFSFDEISAVTLVGKKKMNIYVGDTTYQLFKSPKTNLLKYMHAYYVIKNRKGGENNEFIGI